jgi:hypothetical protein
MLLITSFGSFVSYSAFSFSSSSFSSSLSPTSLSIKLYMAKPIVSAIDSKPGKAGTAKAEFNFWVRHTKLEPLSLSANLIWLTVKAAARPISFSLLPHLVATLLLGWAFGRHTFTFCNNCYGTFDFRFFFWFPCGDARIC